MENKTPHPASAFRPIEKPSVTSAVLDDSSRFADPSVIRGHVQQLHLLTSRIEEFLSYQIVRLQAIETSVPEPQVSSSADLDRLIDEFEQIRRKWEAERQRETERQRGDAERLLDAWRNLEVEQRQLIMRQAAMRSGGTTSIDIAATPVAVGAMYPARVAAGPRAVNTGSQQFNGELGAAPSHKAQIQFQQLRREMQKHAQQRNKR